MEADPPPQPDPNSSDFLVLLLMVDPYAHTPMAAFTYDAKVPKGVDDPLLQGGDKCSDIPVALRQVNHDIGNPLSRPVVGILSPPARRINRQAGCIEKIPLLRAGSCRIKGR